MALINSNSVVIRAGRVAYRLAQLKARNYAVADIPLGKTIMTAERSNEMIARTVSGKKPAMISRFGTPESKALLNYLQIKATSNPSLVKKVNALFKGNIDYWFPDVRDDLRNLVGVFPVTDTMLWEFCEYYTQEIKNIDAIGVWGFVPGENYLISKYCPNALAYDPIALEPYFFQNPWSASLAGKKVLVIHPFEETIISQYSRREEIFPGTDILPPFELKTIKAVQSIAGNTPGYDNWFDALQAMKDQVDQTDFDIAIIGAGSYGLPLSSYVKSIGKVAIHIGGAVQILFGIKGKRWDDHPEVSKLYNENWVRPSKAEVVPRAAVVEGGCYW